MKTHGNLSSPIVPIALTLCILSGCWTARQQVSREVSGIVQQRQDDALIPVNAPEGFAIPVDATWEKIKDRLPIIERARGFRYEVMMRNANRTKTLYLYRNLPSASKTPPGLKLSVSHQSW